MKLPLPSPVWLLFLAFLSCSLLGQDRAAQERREAVSLLAFGQLRAGANAAKRDSGARTVADLLQDARNALMQGPELQKTVVDNACADAFGARPSDEERERWAKGAKTYAEVLGQQLQWLTQYPAEYDKVLRRAYQCVIRRDPFKLEIEYWKQQPTLPFDLLVGALDSWRRRNQPGLMVTSGVATVAVSCPLLETLSVSPQVAAELRAAFELQAAGATAFDAAYERNLIAPGAAALRSSGGIHFVAVGASQLRAGLAPAR